MRTFVQWATGVAFIVGALGATYAGSGLHQMGDLGGKNRAIGYNLARLPGETGQTLTIIAATSYAERILWHHQPDPTQDWVQAVGDPSQAGFLVQGRVRRAGTDPDALAVFGLRDDEETTAVQRAILGSSYAEDRAEIVLPSPLVRTAPGTRNLPLETRFGEVSRLLLTQQPDRDAKTIAAVGVVRVVARSMVRRTGRGEWTLSWTVENRTGTDYAFEWPSVLTDGGEAWQGTVPGGATATLDRIVPRRPRVLDGVVSLTRPGEVHPDFRGPAATYAPAE